MFEKKFWRKRSRRDYEKYKEQARALVHARLLYFNQYYGFKIGQVRIKNQKTRWGSCSKRGNLNFSYRLAILPQHLADYVVLHELCHLGEFNHSINFWNLVARQMPDYAARRKELSGRGVRGYSKMAVLS